jgi:hypothetical protein
MTPVGFEPAIPASARPQTYALDRANTGIGSSYMFRPYTDHHRVGTLLKERANVSCLLHLVGLFNNKRINQFTWQQAFKRFFLNPRSVLLANVKLT